MLLPVRWRSENAARDGLELTKVGYLKPAMVKRAMDELGRSDPIMGKGNRETHARQVLELHLHLSGIVPTWNREMEAIRGAMLAARFSPHQPLT